jgi:hypothetical protein
LFDTLSQNRSWIGSIAGGRDGLEFSIQLIFGCAFPFYLFVIFMILNLRKIDDEQKLVMGKGMMSKALRMQESLYIQPAKKIAATNAKREKKEKLRRQ